MNILSSYIGQKEDSKPARQSFVRYMLIGVLMLVVSALAMALRFEKPVASSTPKLNLEAMIPAVFSDWQVDYKSTMVPLAPELRALIEKAYDQTLTRNYLNSHGDRIMLSIAYGGNRQEEMQAHRPESCYPAQGFSVSAERAAELVTSYGALPIKRLLALRGSRSEPITYWLVLGGKPTRFGLEHRLATLRFALTGRIPDGMLVRVSTIGTNLETAYQHQDAFLNDLLAALTTESRLRLIGETNK